MNALDYIRTLTGRRPGRGVLSHPLPLWAGLLAHAYRPQLVGLSTRVFAGWLEVSADGGAVYAPHAAKGSVAPPRKNLLLISNGLLAKAGMWQARRSGKAGWLQRLAAEKQT